MSKLDRCDPDELRHNPRATYDSWLKYEGYVKKAMHMHPNSFVYYPHGSSPVSFASKIRDAIRGAIAFAYIEDVEALRRWYSEVVIRPLVDSVVIGPKEKKVSELHEKPRGMVFSSLSFEETNAFALLLSHGKIEGPITIQSCVDLPLPRPNLEILKKEDGSVTLL